MSLQETIRRILREELDFRNEFNSNRIKNRLINAEKITNSLIKNNWVEHRKKDKI